MLQVYWSLWTSETVKGLKLASWIVSCDNGMVFSTFNITNFGKILLKIAIVFKIFEYFCPFLSLTINTGQRSFLSLADGLHDKYPESKTVFEHFLYCKMCKLFLLHFALSVFFLYDLVANKSRKLEVVESILIMEKNPSSHSLSPCWRAFLSFSFSLTFNLAFSLSLSS